MAMRAKGMGITKRSHWIFQAREAAKAMGMIGRCDNCDEQQRPGLELPRAARADHPGVIAGEMPSLHQRLVEIAQRPCAGVGRGAANHLPAHARAPAWRRTRRRPTGMIKNPSFTRAAHSNKLS